MKAMKENKAKSKGAGVAIMIKKFSTGIVIIFLLITLAAGWVEAATVATATQTVRVIVLPRGGIAEIPAIDKENIGKQDSVQSEIKAKEEVKTNIEATGSQAEAFNPLKVKFNSEAAKSMGKVSMEKSADHLQVLVNNEPALNLGIRHNAPATVEVGVNNQTKTLIFTLIED